MAIHSEADFLKFMAEGWLERLEREDPGAAVCLAAEVLGRQASTIGPRVWHLSDEDGEKPPLRVEVYKGEVAARRKAQMEAVARHKAEVAAAWMGGGVMGPWGEG